MSLFFLDVETSTLDPKVGSILQLGMVHPRTKAVLDLKIHPGDYEISAESLKITGIDIEEHKTHAVEPGYAIGVLQQFIKNENGPYRANVCCHNSPFDKAWVMEMFEREKQEFGKTFHFIWEDTMPIFKSLASRKVINPPNFRLDGLCTYFGIPLGRLHDAVEDCNMTIELYKVWHKMTEELKKCGVDWKNLWKE